MSRVFRLGLRHHILRSAALRTHRAGISATWQSPQLDFTSSFLSSLPGTSTAQAVHALIESLLADEMTNAQEELVASRPLPDEVPPLPEIQSQELRMQVFTHRSLYARPTHLFEDRRDDLSPDNERLEHLGDSVVGLLTTEMILERFPGLRCGPATKIKSLCVGNPTLAAIAVRYHLPDRLRVHPAQMLILRASANVQADTFEAYCGALFLEAGLDGMRVWFRSLVMPWVEEAYKIMKIEHGVDDDALDPKFLANPPNLTSSQRLPPGVLQPTGHLSLFNQTLSQRAKFVEWVFEDGAVQGRTPMWYVEALVDSRCVGKGKGGTKKAAKNEAAKHALIYLGVYEPQPEGAGTTFGLDDVIERMTRNNQRPVLQ